MTLDLQKYKRHFSHLDISDEAKTRVLEQLRTIAESVADHAWGQHAAQQIPCGQVEENSSNPALTAPFGIECFHGMIAVEFERAAADANNARRVEDIEYDNEEA